MRNLFTAVCILSICFLFLHCSTSKKTMSGKIDVPPVVVVSYAQDVAPIMIDRCTPCHFPDGGKKKFLDTYAAVSTNIDDIISRVEMHPDSSEFMPFKSKKPPLSDSLIQVLRVWKESGMAE